MKARGMSPNGSAFVLVAFAALCFLVTTEAATGPQVSVTRNCPTTAAQGVSFGCEVLIQNTGDVRYTITGVTDTYTLAAGVTVDAASTGVSPGPVVLEWFDKSVAITASSSTALILPLPSDKTLAPGQIASYVVFFTAAVTGAPSIAGQVQVSFTSHSGATSPFTSTPSPSVTVSAQQNPASQLTSQISFYPSKASVLSGTPSSPSYEVFVFNQASDTSYPAQVLITPTTDLALQTPAASITPSLTTAGVVTEVCSVANGAVTCTLDGLPIANGRYRRITMRVTTTAGKEATTAPTGPYQPNAKLVVAASASGTTFSGTGVYTGPILTANLYATKLSVDFGTPTCAPTTVDYNAPALCSFTLTNSGSVAVDVKQISINMPDKATFGGVTAPVTYSAYVSGGNSANQCGAISAVQVGNIVCPEAAPSGAIATLSVEGSTWKRPAAATPTTFTFKLTPQTGAAASLPYKAYASVQPVNSGTSSSYLPTSASGTLQTNDPTNSLNVAIAGPGGVATNTKYYYMVTATSTLASGTVSVSGVISSSLGYLTPGEVLWSSISTYQGTNVATTPPIGAVSSGCGISSPVPPGATQVTWNCLFTVTSLPIGTRYFYISVTGNSVTSSSAGSIIATATASATAQESGTTVTQTTNQWSTNFPVITCSTYWQTWSCTADGSSGWKQNPLSANTPVPSFDITYRATCCSPTCSKNYLTDAYCSDIGFGVGGQAGWVKDPAALGATITDTDRNSERLTCCNPTCLARYPNSALCASACPSCAGYVLKPDAATTIIPDYSSFQDLNLCCTNVQRCSDLYPTDNACDADTQLDGTWARNESNAGMVISVPATLAQKQQCCKKVVKCSDIYRTTVDCGFNYDISLPAVNVTVVSNNATLQKTSCCRPLPAFFTSSCPGVSSAALNQEFTFTFTVQVNHGDYQSASGVTLTLDTNSTSNLQLIKAAMGTTPCTITDANQAQRITCAVGSVSNATSRNVSVTAKPINTSPTASNAAFTYTLSGTSANFDLPSTMVTVQKLCSFPVTYTPAQLFARVTSEAPDDKIQIGKNYDFTVAGSVLTAGTTPITSLTLESRLTPTKHNSPLPAGCKRTSTSSDSTDVVVCTFTGTAANPVTSQSVSFTTTAPNEAGTIEHEMSVKTDSDPRTPAVTDSLTVTVFGSPYIPGANCGKVYDDGTDWIGAGNQCPTNFVYDPAKSAKTTNPGTTTCCTKQTVPTPSLTVTVSATPRSVKRNSGVTTLTFTVSNPSSSSAASDVLSSNLPSTMTITPSTVQVGGKSTADCKFSGLGSRTMSCNLGTVASNTKVRISIKAKTSGRVSTKVTIRGLVGCTKGPKQVDAACTKSGSTSITVA